MQFTTTDLVTMSDPKAEVGKHLVHAEYPDSQYFYLDRRKGGSTRGGNELFQAIQDPVFVVTPGGIIVGVNHAALKAAQKSREEIIGKGICKIIHGGSSPICNVLWKHVYLPALPVLKKASFQASLVNTSLQFHPLKIMMGVSKRFSLWQGS